jgi:hypothetical protein
MDAGKARVGCVLGCTPHSVPSRSTIARAHVGLSALVACAAFATFGIFGQSAWADQPPALSPQTLTLPDGPTSIKGLGESFSPNLAAGGAGYSVDIELPPAILAPSLKLAYSTGTGKGELGVGFSLSKFFVYRSTDKGLPRFDETDRFAVSSPELNDELVQVNAEARWYRLKNEGSFALFIRSQRTDSWTVRFANGETAYLGTTTNSRQVNSHAAYRWFVARREDRFGHAIEYDYIAHRGHRYLSGIRYQLHAPAVAQNQAVLEYNDRADPFTDYTYGEADTTAKRLQRILVYHGTRLLRTYDLQYASTDIFSVLASVKLTGESGLSMPPLSFGYVPRTNEGASLVSMGFTPPIEGLLEGYSTLEDVNGDGLPDLLIGEAGKYRYYENVNGQRWAADPIYLGNPPYCNLGDPDVVLADVNGDGFRDVVYSMGNQFQYYVGGDIKDGVFRHFSGPVGMYPEVRWGVGWGSPEVRITDLNHDGRSDMLYQMPGLVQQVINHREDWLTDRDLGQP